MTMDIFYISKLIVGIFLAICGSRHVAQVASREIKLPANFKFGTGSSSYQVEGGWNADGKGPSIWDTFTHEHPELIQDKSNADVAVNSYNRYKEDVGALKSLGVQFYRFSISWSRVLSNGDISSRNQPGIDYYHKLIQALLDKGIEPVVTIFHGDLPQFIQDMGGFTNRFIVNYFEQYANLLFSEYGDKVKVWITLNEPKTYCEKGYALGTWAPGIKLSGVGDYYCSHYSLLAHARMYHLYKAKYFPTQNGRIGIALNTNYYFPLIPNLEEDLEAAERAFQFSFCRYADPIFSAKGDYPEVVRKIIDENSEEQGYLRSRLPRFTQDEIEYIRGTSDFLGINYYTSSLTTFPYMSGNFPVPSVQHDTFTLTYHDASWPRIGRVSYIPEGLHNLLKWIRDNYNNIEVIITENGSPDDGRQTDVFRLKYLQGHLAAISDAISDGCNVTGHTTWSLIDNFDWESGYTMRFGILEVDAHLNRVEKLSAGFLRDVIAERSFEFNGW